MPPTMYFLIINAVGQEQTELAGPFDTALSAWDWMTDKADEHPPGYTYDVKLIELPILESRTVTAV